jgi:hypothetical protein
LCVIFYSGIRLDCLTTATNPISLNEREVRRRLRPGEEGEREEGEPGEGKKANQLGK